MPVFRCGSGLVFFAHVPKCAGTAVERYLETRFGALGMHDPAFGTRGPAEAWSLSPPQHIPEAVRAALLPDSLFDAMFATVRHPAHRLRSVFLFQREVERALRPKLSFEAWLAGLPRLLATDPYALHGHIRPMSEFVPRAARVFRVEDGLDPLVAWLDTLAGDGAGPRRIAPANVLARRLEHAGRKTPEIGLSTAALEIIAELYAGDYARFGYAGNPAAPDPDGD